MCWEFQIFFLKKEIKIYFSWWGILSREYQKKDPTFLFVVCWKTCWIILLLPKKSVGPVLVINCFDDSTYSEYPQNILLLSWRNFDKTTIGAQIANDILKYIIFCHLMKKNIESPAKCCQNYHMTVVLFCCKLWGVMFLFLISLKMRNFACLSLCLIFSTFCFFVRTRLVSVATQKFMLEVANDALQYVLFLCIPFVVQLFSFIFYFINCIL